ncbi:MAG: hypothetical protein E4G94_04060 [ANME-2 cluster archaeon]|nr:MAG: hypothetical protein E4G94_04060 [ANME-2 cluster archaeon]
MVVGYSTTIELMWIDIWGNSDLASVVLIAVFVMLCAVKKHDIAASGMVIAPILWGLIFVEYLPIYVKAIFIIITVSVGGLGILKFIGLRGQG